MVPDQCANCGELGEVDPSDGYCSFSCRVEADILAGGRTYATPPPPPSSLPQLPAIPPYPDGEASESEEGLKYDEEKLPLQLLPFDSLEAIAQILEHGRKKYSANNWRKGIVYSRLFGACMRHMFAWWRGQDHDPDTGYSHLAHAACCVVFLLHFVLAGATQLDDRAENNA